MSSPSSPSQSIIRLPKGGGALQGIGEKFAPDLHTGTGNFTIPLALLPGLSGFQPQLNLVYSPGDGNLKPSQRLALRCPVSSHVALSWSAKAFASASPISNKLRCCQPVACTSQAAAACPGRAALYSAWLRGAPASSGAREEPWARLGSA